MADSAWHLPFTPPKDARFVLACAHDNGYQVYYTVVGRRKINHFTVDPDGVVVDLTELKNGKKHGRHRYFHEHTGTLNYEASYRRGKLHGRVRQWSDRGELISSVVFRDGTGVDLWCGNDGQLWEYTEIQSGKFHGLQRWWNDDQATIYIERYWRRFLLHGVEREWNHKGHLRRGFPKFHIDGKQVAKEDYITQSARRRTLVPFDPEDNRPAREFPRAFLQMTERLKRSSKQGRAR